MNFDYTIFSKINGLAGHNKLLDLFMVEFTKYGILLYGLILLYLWFKPSIYKQNKKLVFKAVISTLIALGINQIIGLAYFRPRPFAHHHVNLLVDKSPDPSFPSDHSTGSSALTLAIFKQDRILGSVMWGITLLLMVSRIYVGTHYPLDIIGGFVTALLGNLLVNVLWPYIDNMIESIIDIYNKFIPV